MSEIEVCQPGAGTPGACATEPEVMALAPFNRWVIVVGGLLFAVLMAVSVWICTGLRHPWAQMWPQLRHYD
jgi:hypothetical protein